MRKDFADSFEDDESEPVKLDESSLKGGLSSLEDAE